MMKYSQELSVFIFNVDDNHLSSVSIIENTEIDRNQNLYMA